MSASEESSGFEQIQLNFGALNSLSDENAATLSEMVIKLLTNADYAESFLSDLTDITEKTRYSQK